MSQLEQLINLLTARYNSVNEASTADFFLELDHFVEFIFTNKRIKSYTKRLYNRLQQEAEDFNKAREKLIEQLNQIRQKLATSFPDLDDSQIPIPDHPHDYNNPEYRYTLATFDRAVDSAQEKSRKGNLTWHDEPLIDILIGILAEKFKAEQLDRDLLLELEHIREDDLHLRRSLENYQRTSPEFALIVLQRLLGYVNPQPQHYQTFNELFNSVVENVISGDNRLQNEIQGIIYQGNVNIEAVERCKTYLYRVYRGIIDEMNSNQASNNLWLPLASAGISFFVGILGNLIASGIQQYLPGNAFSPLSLLMLLLLAVIGLIGGILLQNQSSISLKWGTIIIIAVALSVYGGAIVIRPVSPEENSFSYQVRVQAKNTRDQVSNAKVTIEVTELAPLDEITDTNGLARINIPASYAGKPARLLIEASGYQLYRQEINLLKGNLPDTIQLDPLP